MKKLAVLLLMISSLVASTTAMATPASNGNLTNAGKNGISTLASANVPANMPCFREGDILEFSLTDLVVLNQLTLISYKCNNIEDLDDAVVQYIDQRSVVSEGETVRYKIRNTTDGIYKIVINGNGEEDGLLTFYYKVGNPEFSMITSYDSNYYAVKKLNDNNYSVAFVAKVTLDNDEVSLSDTGIEKLGFKFVGGDIPEGGAFSTEALTGMSRADHHNIETDGAISFVYGITMNDLPSDNGGPIIITAVPAEKLIGSNEEVSH